MSSVNPQISDNLAQEDEPASKRVKLSLGEELEQLADKAQEKRLQAAIDTAATMAEKKMRELAEQGGRFAFISPTGTDHRPLHVWMAVFTKLKGPSPCTLAMAYQLGGNPPPEDSVRYLRFEWGRRACSRLQEYVEKENATGQMKGWVIVL